MPEIKSHIPVLSLLSMRKAICAVKLLRALPDELFLLISLDVCILVVCSNSPIFGPINKISNFNRIFSP